MGIVRALIVWLQAPAQLGSQTRFVNRQDSRSGTLWEGRYESSPIDPLFSLFFNAKEKTAEAVFISQGAVSGLFRHP